VEPLTSHLDLVPDAPPGAIAEATRVAMRGGLARLATLVAAARADNPNTLLLNVGDTYHRGVEALFTNGNAIVGPLDALGIDAAVPGNWDFAYGPIVTRARYGAAPRAEVLRPSLPSLAANVSYAAPDPRAGEPLLPATVVRDVGGGCG
jgi:2',3'-cyclic-nucleotide 2'-phosphodiesterase (5'-nucleotidase family)